MTTSQPNEFQAYVKIGASLISSAADMCKESGLKPTNENIKLCTDIILKLQQAAILLSTINQSKPKAPDVPDQELNMMAQKVRFKPNA